MQFYGSVIKIDGKYRMWYVAAGDDRLERSGPRFSPWRVAYAESTDGFTWTKPNLGLVEYKGNKDNNLVNIETDPFGILNVKVLYEPEPIRPNATRCRRMPGLRKARKVPVSVPWPSWSAPMA